MLKALGPTELPVVYVVDDDAAVRKSLQFALELDGFRVETLESGEALLLRDLPRERVCLVLDERLVGITGLDAVGQLRRRGIDLPAILITSNPKPELRRAAAAAGVPIVEKPLIGDALLAAIRDALGV